MHVSELPRTFATVVSRDRWMWDNADVPLLSAAAQDRLLDMCHDIESPGQRDWAMYAIRTASQLETERRWPEAQAYWFACLHALARAELTMSDDYELALAGVIRNAGISAGIAVEDSSLPWRELVSIAMGGLSVPARSAVVRSLILAGTEYHSIYDDLDLEPPVRRALAQVLTELFMSARSESSAAKQRQSHEVFSKEVETFTKYLGQLTSLTEELRANPTLEYLLAQRESLFGPLMQLSRLTLEYDKPLITKIHTLLSTKLTAYSNVADEVGQEAFDEISNSVESILAEGQEVGSHLGACLFVPLAMLIGTIVDEHYAGVLHAKSASLHVKLQKPEARRTGRTTSLEIEVTNDGSDAAEDCELQFKLPVGDQYSLKKESIWFGRVARGQSKTERCDLSCPPSVSVLELDYTLEWRDRSGTHSMEDHLKVVRQREVDWSAYDSMPAPYIEKSISDPARLHGREQALRTLRFGFQAKGSFMITGQRRVGKTSLVKVFLAEVRQQPDVLTLYVPIGELSAAEGADDIGRLGRDLADRVAEEFEVRFSEPLGIAIPKVDEFRDAFNSSFSRFIRQFTMAHKLRLAFALDDFDELPTQLFTGSTGRAFFLALRALIDQGTSFFFIGSERLPAIMAEQAERLNQLRPLAVDYLDRSALASLVREPVKDRLWFNEDSLDEIEVWSARNPYFATLICNSIWERALESQDYWVTKRDVELAVRQLADRTKRNSYQHFWSDSPLGRDDERTLYATKSLYIMLSLARYQPDPLAFADRHPVTANSEGLTAAEAEQHLKQLIDHTVVEAHKEKPELIRVRVPLFMQWLKLRGATELRETLVARGSLSLRAPRRSELTPEEVITVADGLTYRGERISTDQIRAWAAQFGDVDDQRVMLKLLRGVQRGLYSESKFRLALSQLHDYARQRTAQQRFTIRLGARNMFANWYVTHVDHSGKSGSAMVKQYRSENRIPTPQCGSPSKILPLLTRNRSDQAIIVCVDDFVGTGQSAAADIKGKFLPLLEQSAPDWRERVLIIFAALVGFEDGLSVIEDEVGSEVSVIAGCRLTAADRAFSEDNDLFESVGDRERARELARKVGSVLERRHPLGWEDSQALVVFPDNVPNNTLPILYKDGVDYNGKPWRALFPRS